ncbi:hypothetical protein AMTR_s00057p00205560 [Amborella trichopoda]|uniref:Uncharacterized protein n=1 Tax=Amborella trichopoda TaxID=13333 RepID=U5D3I0_AMBTC|nr:hypothetical protein AMTR_s00057p00205560 [Amborella trichopoda]
MDMKMFDEFLKEITPRSANEGAVLEERDPGYDAMLSQMVGRIITKPGGKLEMGEAFVVEKYKRPLPKLRDTKADAGRDEKSVVAPGTLNVSQLRQVFFLHQGKDGGSMGVQQIAEKLRVDAAHVENILRHLSLPPESNKETEK